MRAKDEGGMTLPPPHKRLENAGALIQSAFFEISRDGRCAHLTTNKKLGLVRKAVDHVVDGDKMPAWVHKGDVERPDNHAMLEIWRLAVAEVRTGLGKI